MPAKYVVSKDAAGEFRWLLKASNGEPIADSNEGYKAHKECLAAVGRLRKYATTKSVEDTTEEGAAAAAKAKARKKAAGKKAKPAKKAKKK